MEHSAPTGYYFAPPSHWPIVGSIALFLLAIGGILLMNGMGGGWIPFAIGFFTLVYMLFGWFGTVIRESEGGLFNSQVDLSFRWAMGWFIFSEVMFFGAFFGALFYARVYSVPWLGDIDNRLLWPDFAAHWPTVGPYRPMEFTPMHAWGIPAINTMLLLSSGVTVTWAHWALKMHDGGIRVDLLHAHRIPRLPRDAGRDDAHRDPLPLRGGPLQARPPLRLRGGVVVLALRGRGVAAALHLRVLGIAARGK